MIRYPRFPRRRRLRRCLRPPAGDHGSGGDADGLLDPPGQRPAHKLRRPFPPYSGRTSVGSASAPEVIAVSASLGGAWPEPSDLCTTSATTQVRPPQLLTGKAAAVMSSAT